MEYNPGHSGISLDLPQQEKIRGGRWHTFLLFFPLLLLGGWGSICCFYTVFPVPVIWQWTIPCLGIISIISTVVFVINHKRWVWILLLGALWLGTLYFFLEIFLDGMVQTVNQIIDTFVQQTDLPLRKIAITGISEYPAREACTVFAVFVFSFFLLFLAWLLVSRRMFFLSFLLTLPFAAVPVSYLMKPDPLAIGALLLFWFSLFLMAFPLTRREKDKPWKGVFIQRGNYVTGPIWLVLLPILGLLFLCVLILFPSENYRQPLEVEKLREQIVFNSPLAPLMNSNVMAESNQEFDLRNVGNLTFQGKTMLRVRSSSDRSEYLKGYVGSIYTGESWKALDAEVRAQIDPTLKGYKAQNMMAQTAFLFSQTTPDVFSLEIENVGASSKDIYVPYGLITRPEDLSEFTFVDDGYLQADNLWFGTRKYEIQAVQTPSIAELAQLKPIIAENSESSDFLMALQGYSMLVKTQYLQLPDDLRPQLEEYLAQRGIQPSKMDTLTLANTILTQLQQENEYTLSPGNTPEEEDFVSYFLFENHKGYCTHFASAATTLLRAAGIPARFAGGYVLPQGQEQGEMIWQEIPDSSAHAWTEIYLDGVGWIPLEATPPDGRPLAQSQYSTNLDENGTEESKPLITEQPTTESSDQTQEFSQSTSGENQTAETSKRENTWILFLTLGIAALLLVAALLWCHRKWRLYQRHQSFSQTNFNQAAIFLYDHMERLCWCGKKSDGIPEEITQLYLKARYSQHPLTSDEIKRMLEYDYELVSVIGKQMNSMTRIFYQYIWVLL